MKLEDLLNRKFGRLTPLQALTSQKGTRWLCRCDCGKTKLFWAAHLKRGFSTSCGCYAREVNARRMTTHGLTKTGLFKDRFWLTWRNIKNRCENPNIPSYPRYGGRGIKVLWSTFSAFRDDMYPSYLEARTKYPASFSLNIDRKDNAGHYSKENCRWVTPKLNQRNRRDSFLVKYNGQSRTLPEWSEITKIPIDTLRARIKRYRWPIEKALTTPVLH